LNSEWDGIIYFHQKKVFDNQPKPEGLIRDYEGKETMSAYTVLWIVSAVALFIGLRDIFRILPRRPTITNLVICLLGFCFFCLGLGMSALFDEKDVPPPAPYADNNKAVLATVKEGDLLLCTDPASSQVKQVLVIKFISPDKTFIQGRGMDKRGSFEDSFFRADRSNCQLSEPIRDPIKVRLKVGEIVLDGLNPPSPAPK